MTTDDFAEAAEDRADELWPYAPAGIPLPPAKRMDRRVGFRLGAQWAHDYLAAQEVTDAEVEAAAIALYNDDESWGFVVQFAYGDQAVEWDDLGDGPQEMFREFARRALHAARAARRDEEKRDG